MRKLLVTLAMLAFAIVGVAPVAAQEPTQTIAEIAGGNPDFSTLMAAVGAADPAFAAALTNADANLTVFAPTNAAFEALLAALNLKAEELLANQALLNVVLAYHVIPGVYPAAGVANLNGVVIGTMLPDLGATDAGFPKNGLAIGVADGKVSLTTSAGAASNVVAVDVMATNGVVHVIDAVLVPADATTIASEMADMMSATPEATAEAGAAEPVSIAATVVAAAGGSPAQFTTLLAAVQAADPLVLAELSNGGPFTVFAPTDEAFAAALTALNTTPEALLADKAALTRILAYHVVPGEFKAATVLAATKNGAAKIATYLGGTSVEIMTKDGKVMVNNATVVATDVLASNGVVHVIDAVLLPPAE
jgi:uncharacterized surface protein with fasciclin (FAS1) repeats